MRSEVSLLLFCQIYGSYASHSSPDYAEFRPIFHERSANQQLDMRALCGSDLGVSHTSVGCEGGICKVTVRCNNGKDIATYGDAYGWPKIVTREFECLEYYVINDRFVCTSTCTENKCTPGSLDCERKDDGSCGARRCYPFCDINGGCKPLENQRNEPMIQNPDGTCHFPNCHPFCNGRGGCWPSDRREKQPDGSCDFKKCHPFCDGHGGCLGPREIQQDGSCDFKKCHPFCDGNGGCIWPKEIQQDGSCEFADIPAKSHKRTSGTWGHRGLTLIDRDCFPFCQH